MYLINISNIEYRCVLQNFSIYFISLFFFTGFWKNSTAGFSAHWFILQQCHCSAHLLILFHNIDSSFMMAVFSYYSEDIDYNTLKVYSSLRPQLFAPVFVLLVVEFDASFLQCWFPQTLVILDCELIAVSFPSQEE